VKILNPKIIIMLIVVAVLGIVIFSASKIPVYHTSALHCGEDAYHRSSLIKGGSKQKIDQDAEAVRMSMALQLCFDPGTVRYELYVF